MQKTLTLALLLLLTACSQGSDSAHEAGPAETADETAQGPDVDAPTSRATTPKIKAPGVGDRAPYFSLPDEDGTQVSLTELKGKIVVLQWFNPECVYTRHAHMGGNLGRIAARWEEKGVVWLTINSAGPGQEGYGVDYNIIWKPKYGIDNAMLFDETGEVGHLYAAKRTPECFVIDKQGTIVYHGAADNKPQSSLLEGHDKEIHYVDAALSDLEAGRKVAIPETRPYGCSIRYAKP